jgi:hypothetical protein
VYNGLIQAEVSWFNGHEPDQDRWLPESPALNSWSVRLSATPLRDWAIQGSFAALDEPEQLHPVVDVYRSTLSLVHYRAWSDVSWSSALAWGRNVRRRTTITLAEARARLSPPLLAHYLGLAPLPPGADDTLLLLFDKRVQSAVLVETALTWGGTSVFARYEGARKDELVPPPDLRHSQLFRIAKLEVGFARELETVGALRFGLGAAASVHWIPDELAVEYGSARRSYTLFTRVEL